MSIHLWFRHGEIETCGDFTVPLAREDGLFEIEYHGDGGCHASLLLTEEEMVDITERFQKLQGVKSDG